MSSHDSNGNHGTDENRGQEPEAVVVEVIPELPTHALPVARARRRRLWLPLGLFLATCVTTLWAGGIGPGLSVGLKAGEIYGWAYGLKQGLIAGLAEGWKYALPLLTILICHEAGHFIQTLRCRVHASLPYFIPMPAGPLGTVGAVIAMDPRMGNRKALFDIGITGPLAGLVPTLIFCIVGLQWSEPRMPSEISGGLPLGEPLLFRLFTHLTFGRLPPGQDIVLHPMAFAGWVGLLLTALNLLPIGQLDGGHVLYALLRDKARHVASLLLLLAAVAVSIAVFQYHYYVWSLMLLLLILIGPLHPPTANDDMPLGTGRSVLGWLTLAFVPIGLTPTPFII